MKITFWHWPDHNIGKRESRRLRDEHNALANYAAELQDAGQVKPYERVLPRDAFNESNLLKCIGKLTLIIHNQAAPQWTFEHDGKPFDIQQDQSDGSLYVANITFRWHGKPVRVYRPLNAREPWPLVAEPDKNGEPFIVFTDHGELEQ